MKITRADVLDVLSAAAILLAVCLFWILACAVILIAIVCVVVMTLRALGVL